MFDRKKYKDFARIQLRNRWVVPVLMVLVTQLILSVFDLPSLISDATHIDWSRGLISVMNQMSESKSPASTGLDFIKLVIGAIFDLAVIHVYLKMSRSPEQVSFSEFVEGLSDWGRAVLSFFWQFLWMFLWAFLFIFPAFIKAYAYSQMYYLVAEFPRLSIRKAMRISIEITRGHKMDLFILDLSFIGWFVLSALTGGLLNFYVSPYFNMTRVNAYHALLKEAVESGRISLEDLQNE